MSKIYHPEEFDKFPIENTKQRWFVHRIKEHHFRHADFSKYEDTRFIFHGIDAEGFEKNVIYIVPESMQKILEFLVNRGRIEQGKADASALKSIMQFLNADPVAGMTRH